MKIAVVQTFLKRPKPTSTQIHSYFIPMAIISMMKTRDSSLPRQMFLLPLQSQK